MAQKKRRSLAGSALRGAIAGAVATWLMDQVTTALLEKQSAEDTQSEEQARPNGKSSIENMLDRAEQLAGLQLGDEQRPLALQAIHYGLGVIPGAMYGVLRSRLSLVGAGRGVVYGLLLFAINDEYLNTELGFAGPYDAYPAQTHLRGALGHAVLGGTTDTVLDLLGG
jgi:hypothetical protein